MEAVILVGVSAFILKFWEPPLPSLTSTPLSATQPSSQEQRLLSPAALGGVGNLLKDDSDDVAAWRPRLRCCCASLQKATLVACDGKEPPHCESSLNFVFLHLTRNQRLDLARVSEGQMQRCPSLCGWTQAVLVLLSVQVSSNTQQLSLEHTPVW